MLPAGPLDLEARRSTTGPVGTRAPSDRPTRVSARQQEPLRLIDPPTRPAPCRLPPDDGPTQARQPQASVFYCRQTRVRRLEISWWFSARSDCTAPPVKILPELPVAGSVQLISAFLFYQGKEGSLSRSAVVVRCSAGRGCVDERSPLAARVHGERRQFWSIAKDHRLANGLRQGE